MIFDGKDILPKAATPMTAALTVLEYGGETEAQVEFFTQEDVNDIQQDYNSYLSQFASLEEEEFKKLSKIKARKQELSEALIKEIREKAKKRAEISLRKNDKLFSAYDQYLKIKNSGVLLSELAEYKTITAQNSIELNDKLLNFVGANGIYMPFTKSVTLKLNEESLKDIQIIDTPGVNDPVTSREERTKDLLKYCDVVFVVSPSGQFLSSEDLELMDRITTKEGIKEIYIIASQVDNQLFGSEKEKGNGIFNSVLNVIEDNLSNLQKNVLLKQKNQFPEIGNTFDNLINNRVLLSSATSYSMMKNFDNQSEWDENTQKVWENLSKHYKDFFDNKESALAYLEKLANIDRLKDIISDVRNNKEEILQRRKEEFFLAKQKSLHNYKSAIESDIKDSIKSVKDTDIDKIKILKENMLNIQSQAIDVVNEEYYDVIESLEINLKSLLTDKLQNYFKQSRKDIQNSESSDTERWTSKEGGFLGFFQDTVSHSRTFTIVKTGYIRDSLEELTENIEETIYDDSKEHIKNWKKN